MSMDGDGQPELPSSMAEVRVGLRAASDLIVQSYKSDENRESRWFYSPRRDLKRKRDKAIGQAPNDAMGVMLSLIADCDLRAYDAQRASKWWGRAYYLLGLPGAVLATIAGAAALASAAGRIPAAIIALISAGFTTAATFLNSSENKQDNGKLSAAWQQLADDVRLVVIQYGNYVDRLATPSGGDFLIRNVVRFNKRKSALMRGDLNPLPEEQEQA